MGYLVIMYARDKHEVDVLRRAYPYRPEVNPSPSMIAPNVVGVYKFPIGKSKEPMCPGTCEYTKKKLNGWRRRRDGVMVHDCGKRHKHWRKRFMGALFDYLGNNLLPRSRTPKVFQNPDSWGG